MDNVNVFEQTSIPPFTRQGPGAPRKCQAQRNMLSLYINSLTKWSTRNWCQWSQIKGIIITEGSRLQLSRGLWKTEMEQRIQLKLFFRIS